MISKIIFALATVCVVNASVLTVNVFHDDPGTELANNPKDCNFRACEQLCRRLKFPGGVCVNGRCKCDNFLNAEDGVSEKSLFNVEKPVSQQDDPETEIENKKSDCNNQACDQLCRRLKFPGGACVNGRCKCDNFLNAEGDMTDPAEFLSPGSCDFRACDQQCFRFGYPGGTCVNGRCKCGNFLNAEDTMTDPAESLPLSSCNSIACDDKCRRTGWHSGVCIKGQCKCDYFLNTEVAENSLSNLEDSASPRKCTHQECNALCHRLKFREGVCIAGRCSCNNYFPTPKDTMIDLEESMSLDDNFLGTEDVVSDESLPVSELSEDQTERGCNMRACDQLCRRLKFPGGACVNGRCKCDNFFGTEVDAVDDYSELATRRICQLRQCNRTCTRRGYESARCVNGWCKCYNKIQRQDASPLSDVTSDENEESNVIGTNEVPSPRACNAVNCNQMCRRLKYAGGWCSQGQCRCY